MYPIFLSTVSMQFETHCPSLSPQLADSSNLFSDPDVSPYLPHIYLGLGVSARLSMPTVMCGPTFSLLQPKPLSRRRLPSQSVWLQLHNLINILHFLDQLFLPFPFSLLSRICRSAPEGLGWPCEHCLHRPSHLF